MTHRLSRMQTLPGLQFCALNPNPGANLQVLASEFADARRRGVYAENGGIKQNSFRAMALIAPD